MIFGHVVQPLWARAVLAAVGPIWRVEAQVIGNVESTLGANRSRTTLEAENTALRRQVAELTAKLARWQGIERDNESLRAALGRRATSAAPTALARLIAHPWRSPYDTILVDVGQATAAVSLAVGQPVLLADSLYVGEVSEVFGRYSRVRLASAPGTTLEVFLGREGAPAQLEGVGRGNFQARVPRALELAAGDVAVVRRAEGELVAAIVGAVEREPSDSLQTIYLQSPFNLNQVEWLTMYAEALP